MAMFKQQYVHVFDSDPELVLGYVAAVAWSLRQLHYQGYAL